MFRQGQQVICISCGLSPKIVVVEAYTEHNKDYVWCGTEDDELQPIHVSKLLPITKRKCLQIDREVFKKFAEALGYTVGNMLLVTTFSQPWGSFEVIAVAAPEPQELPDFEPDDSPDSAETLGLERHPGMS
jgi:hypothetical protein